MSYATLSQLKAALRVPNSDTVDDSTLQLALDAASEAIIVHCGRTFGTAATDTSRVFAAGKADVVEVDDLSSITAVYFSDDGSTWNITTDYQAEPLNRRADGMPWPITRLRAVRNFSWPVLAGIQSVRVTGVYAFGYVPDAVVNAAALQAAFIFKRADAPFGVAGWGDMGAIKVTRALDPTAEMLLSPYRKLRAAL